MFNRNHIQGKTSCYYTDVPLIKGISYICCKFRDVYLKHVPFVVKGKLYSSSSNLVEFIIYIKAEDIGSLLSGEQSKMEFKALITNP